MQVVVLGAGGAMGETAAHLLAALGAIDDLVLADLDRDAAHATASTLIEATGSVSSTRCDILDPAAIRKLLGDADFVVNCAGPFFRLGVPALQAAIDTGTHYLDICDDPDPTVEMFGLDDAAKRAGVSAVVGMGASPGLSNLLAVRASRELDTVHDCFTAWPLDVDQPGSSAMSDVERLHGADGQPGGAAVHFMEQIHGHVLVVENGVHVRRQPLEAIELTFPGCAPGTGYVVGHPEPITLRDSLHLTGTCVNLVLVASGSTAAYLRGLQRDLDRGKLTLAAAAALLLEPPALRGAKAAVAGLRVRGVGGLPPFFALLRGTKDGVLTTVGCRLTAMPRGMAGATAVPAALAVGQLLERRPQPGVHPPERVIDGDRLLTDLIAHCTTPVDALDALAPITTSR